MFVDGFVGLCSAVGAGAATEMTGAGYARQPCAFAAPVNGSSRLSRGFTFSAASAGGSGAPLAGYGIFDAPTAGNLLLAVPFASTRPWPGSGPVAQSNVGQLTLFLTALASFPDGDSYSGTFGAAAVLGYTYDVAAQIGLYSTGGGFDNTVTVIPQQGGLQLAVHAASLTAGVALTVTRGLLRATSVSP